MKTEKSNDILLIEDYLDGKLSAAEEKKIKKRLENDHDFQSLYKFRLQIESDWINATEYEQTRQQVNSVIMEAKRKGNSRIIIYSVAAIVVLIISIPGALYINKQIDSSNNIAQNQDTITGKVLKPQMEIPEEKASISYLDSLKLTAPTNSAKLSVDDPIVFRWAPALQNEASLVIKTQKENKTVFSEKVLIGQDSLRLSNRFLPVGKYYWFLENKAVKDSFLIVN